MLYNFQLAAILKTDRQTNGLTLVQIQLHQDLQARLADEWDSQYIHFMNYRDENLVYFDPGYSLSEGERFRVDYNLPDWIAGKSSRTVPNLEIFNDRSYDLESIRGIVGFARDEQGEELILFQKFDRSRIIKRQRSIIKLQDSDVYGDIENQGLELDTKLSAIYFQSEARLLFYSFAITKRFLCLDNIFEAASNQAIRDVLSHDLFAPIDTNRVIENISQNQWIRRRFAMLFRSEILDNFSAQDIVDSSQGYDVSIDYDPNNHNQIVFPEDRENITRVLQFLNEELFRGAITQTLYVTNSKREYNQ